MLVYGLRMLGNVFSKSCHPRGSLSPYPLPSGSLPSFLSPCPTFPACARTSSQAAALITSFHFNSAELGACELKRKFMQNTQQIGCAGVLEKGLTLSAPFILPSPRTASDQFQLEKILGLTCLWRIGMMSMVGLTKLCKPFLVEGEKDRMGALAWRIP